MFDEGSVKNSKNYVEKYYLIERQVSRNNCPYYREYQSHFARVNYSLGNLVLHFSEKNKVVKVHLLFINATVRRQRAYIRTPCACDRDIVSFKCLLEERFRTERLRVF